MKYLIDYNTLEKKVLFPGITASIAHADNFTLTRVTLEEGAHLPEHSHPHQQWTHVLSGELEMEVEGEILLLGPGMTATIPSNAKHSGYARTECIVIDVFNPTREDLK
jgi:quercetin dioxygenase-like cupin family protein